MSLRQTLDKLYNGSLALAGLFLVGVFIVMIGEAVLRKTGGYITGASELVGWFSAAAAFLAMPATFVRGQMVRVGLLVDRLPPKLRKPVLIACLLIAITFVAYMLWAVSSYLLSSYQFEEMTQGMIYIQAWIPQLSFLLGVFLLLISMIDQLVCMLGRAGDELWAATSLETATRR